MIEACERAVNALNAVLLRTWNEDSKELRLIQSKNELENPPSNYKLEILP